MRKLDPIFAAHERSLVPGHTDPGGAVRDRILYRSRDQEAQARPQRSFPGSSMDVALPDELDVPAPSHAPSHAPLQTEDAFDDDMEIGDLETGDLRT